MAGNKNGVVPQEYVDRGEKYTLEQFSKDRGLAAMQKMQSSEYANKAPEGWHDTHTVPYLACLGTATGMYGENCIVHSNERFIDENDEDYYANKGFSLVEEGQDWREGDIIQYSDSVKPKHAVMYVGQDKKYKTPLVSYASGTEGAPLKKNRHEGILHSVYGKQYPRRVFRYTGTPEEIAEIEKWNAEVESHSIPFKSAGTKMQYPEVNLLPQEKPNPTTEWLKKFIKR